MHYAIATIIGIALVKMGWRTIRPDWREVCIVCIFYIFFLLEHEGYKIKQENLVAIRDQLVAAERANAVVSFSNRKMFHPLILPMLRSIIASPFSTLQTPYWLASACSRWCGADWRGLGGAGA